MIKVEVVLGLVSGFANQICSRTMICVTVSERARVFCTEDMLHFLCHSFTYKKLQEIFNQNFVAVKNLSQQKPLV